jgi:hypothetical protein
MTAAVMISGSLPRAPESKTSKAGKPYVFASIRVAAGNEVEFWTALAFGETEQAELLRLGEGEKLAVQGALKVEAKAGDGGEIKIRRTVFVDAVLALKPKPRERKAKAEKAPPPDRAAAAPREGRRDFDDKLPF